MVQKTVIDSADLRAIVETERVVLALANTTVPKCYLERVQQAVVDQGVSEDNALTLAIRFSMAIESNPHSRGNCQGSGCPRQGILVPIPGNALDPVELTNLNAVAAVKDALSIADIAGCYLQALRDALVISANEVDCVPSSVDVLGLRISLDVSIDIWEGGNCQGSSCPKSGRVVTGPGGS